MKYFFTLLFLTIISSSQLSAQVITIASARTMATGSVVTVRGIVTNGAEFGGSQRFLQDPTAGISTYSPILSTVFRGDSIEVTGTISPYNNLMEIDVTNFIVISNGNILPAPKLITINSGYQELYEGQLVQIDSVYFTAPGTFASGTDYLISDSTNTGQVRTSSSTNLTGTIIPIVSINIIGIMGQYSSAYQLLPRDLFDIHYNGNYPVFLTLLTQTNADTNSFTVNFTTQNPGTTILYYGLAPDLGTVVSDAALTTTHALDLTGLSIATVYFIQGASVSSTGDTSWSAIQPMMTKSLNPLPCDSTLWDHVYHSYRLVVNLECTSITGIVDELIYPADGDIHLRIHLDPEYNFMLNSVNISEQYGDLVCEPICVNIPTQNDAIEPCLGYINTVYIPNAGEHVMVTGSFVTDTYHGWNEIHPVNSITITTSTGPHLPDSAAINQLQVFPNPASAYINFHFGKLPGSPIFIRIMDAVGRTVGQYQLLESINFRLNTMHLPNGIYYYNVVQNQMVLRSGKFIIVHHRNKDE